MKIRDIIELLESIAPLQYQEEYDNSGLIAGNREAECTGVLVSLDCTEQIVCEAAEKKCNLIVSHHPLIFRPIRRIVTDNGMGRSLIAAIKRDISVYAIHTNLDNLISGVSATIADKLELINRILLLPKAGLSLAGSGLVGDFENPVPEQWLLQELKKRFNIPVIRHSRLIGKPVTRVAICGGAGSFLIPNALSHNVDFFITADVRYHEFFEAEGRFVIADIGHFESEQFTIDLIHDVILKNFRNFAVLKSGTVTNPVNYYI